MKYDQSKISALAGLRHRLKGKLSPAEESALEVAIDAVTLLARAERRDDFGAFVHRLKRDTAAEAPRTEIPLPSSDMRLQCMEIAVRCARGEDIACESCPVAQATRDVTLDCDAGMLQVAIGWIGELLASASGQI